MTKLKINTGIFIFYFGYISLICFILSLILSDLIIYHYCRFHYLINMYKFIFLSKNSPEWVSGLGTLTVALIAVRKIFRKSRPGFRHHIDQDEVSIEIIPSSNVRGFALMTHIYVCDGNPSDIVPGIDFINLYENDIYSEPFGGSHKALIYLKKNKDDDRLRHVIKSSKSLVKNKNLSKYHYIAVYFSINDHTLSEHFTHVININELNSEEWCHSGSFYKKENDRYNRNL